MDFVSWYTNTGKINDLVLTVESRKDRSSLDVDRQYVDYVASVEGMKHDHFFTTFVLKHFITESGFVLDRHGKPIKEKLVLICDNGMMSHEVVYTATKLGEEHGLKIEFLCLCPRHAWSLCDAHGGRVKSLLLRQLLDDQYPSSEEMTAALESGIRRTRVFMVDPIDEEGLTENWYQPVRRVEQFSQFGHIVCKGTGIFHAQSYYNGKDDYGGVEPNSGAPPPVTYIFGDMQGWETNHRCLRCSRYLGKQVFSGHGHSDVCLFSKSQKKSQKKGQRSISSSSSLPESKVQEQVEQKSNDSVRVFGVVEVAKRRVRKVKASRKRPNKEIVEYFVTWKEKGQGAAIDEEWVTRESIGRGGAGWRVEFGGEFLSEQRVTSDMDTLDAAA